MVAGFPTFTVTAGSASQLAGQQITRGGIQELAIAWTSNASGVVTVTGVELSGELLALITQPDSGTAPSDNYGITLTDSNGIDRLNGAGLSRDTANTEQIAPNVAGIIASSWGPTGLAGSFTFNVASAGNAKKGIAIFITRRNAEFL